jgi:protein SCO1
MRRCVEHHHPFGLGPPPFGLSLSKPCVRRRPFDKLRANGWVAARLIAGVASFCVQASVPALDEREALRAGEAAIGRAVPDLVLQDREGRPVRLADYRGKPLLVSFIYTGCFQVCPTQTRALYEAVKGLDVMLGEHQFNVISIGFNQPFDSPEAMRSFARQHRIEHRNWEFASPPREQVQALTQAFGFSFVATPAGFDHVLGVTVVAPDGRIHAQVYGDRLRADQLGIPLRQLILNAPPARAPGVATLIERVRILCTVYDPDTGQYRYDYKLIFELIGGALFFFSVLVYGLLEWRDQRRARRQRCAASPAHAPSA